VLALAGFLAAIAIRPPIAGAQSTEPLTTTDPVPTLTSPEPDPTPDPGPTPAPAPSPSPSPTPTTSDGTTQHDGTKQHDGTRRARHHRHRHRNHEIERRAPTFGPRFERAHAPRDVPIYGGAASVGRIQLFANERSSGGSSQIAPILTALLAAALLLIALVAVPTRAIAGVSHQLLVRRSQVALTGLTILSGIAIGVVVVLLGS
jgi:hypothetical protein